MIIIGKKEEANKTITLRHSDGNQEFGLSVDNIVEKAKSLNEY